MINQPTLNNKILQTLFVSQIISEDQIKEVLAFDKTLLIDDLHAIIEFCSNYFDTIDFDSVEEIDDDKSHYLLIYALFLLKEIDAKEQLNLILDLLHLSDDKLDYWFYDLITEYYFSLVYHFGLLEIEKLVHFLKEEKIETFSKEQVALALYQIYLHNPYSTTIISDYWTELLEFYNNLTEDSDNLDHTYLAFFVCYIAQPNEYQIELIKNLYDKDFIDCSVNGEYEDLFEIIEPKRKILSIFDVNNDFIRFENYPKVDYNSNIAEDFKQFTSQPLILDKKPNRNDPCNCGSGKKYKKCCLN